MRTGGYGSQLRSFLRAHVYVHIRCVSFCASLDSGRVLSYRLGWMDLSQRSHRILFALKVCMSAATLMSSVLEPGTQISVCVCVCMRVCACVCPYMCRLLLWNVFSLDCWAKQLFARELKQADLAWRDLVELRSVGGTKWFDQGVSLQVSGPLSSSRWGSGFYLNAKCSTASMKCPIVFLNRLSNKQKHCSNPSPSSPSPAERRQAWDLCLSAPWRLHTASFIPVLMSPHLRFPLIFRPYCLRLSPFPQSSLVSMWKSSLRVLRKPSVALSLDVTVDIRRTAESGAALAAGTLFDGAISELW